MTADADILVDAQHSHLTGANRARALVGVLAGVGFDGWMGASLTYIASAEGTLKGVVHSRADILAATDKLGASQ